MTKTKQDWRDEFDMDDAYERVMSKESCKDCEAPLTK